MKVIEAICGVEIYEDRKESWEILLYENRLFLIDRRKSLFDRFKVCPSGFDMLKTDVVSVFFAPRTRNVTMKTVAYLVPDIPGGLWRPASLHARRHAGLVRLVCGSGEKSLKQSGVSLSKTRQLRREAEAKRCQLH